MGNEAPGTQAMSCSVLPEEPLEWCCQDRWSHCSSRMINSFNYTLCWGHQCCAQPSRTAHGRTARGRTARGRTTTAVQLQGWMCPGGASPGTLHTRPCGASWGKDPTAQPVAPILLPPCLPRSRASLAEGGAVAGGSHCHLHLTALGTGGSSSSALPGATGNPHGRMTGAGERLAVVSTLP